MFCLYVYFTIILVVKCTKSSLQIFEFEESYPHKSDLIQKSHAKPYFDFLVALIGKLSQYQFKENTILGGHPDTIFRQNNLVDILLALFILWQHFPGMFINADVITYKQCSWDFWSKYEHFLPPYIKALTTNV